MNFVRAHVAIGLLLPVLSCATSAVAQTFQVHTAPIGVETPFHTIFYEGGAPPFENLPLAALRLNEDIAATIPSISGTFGMAELRCTSVGDDRHLQGCTITVAPTDRGYEAAAGVIARQLVVDPAYLLAGKPRTRFISIQLKMWHSDRPVSSGPCWPPGCNPILPPPPPPPSPPGK